MYENSKQVIEILHYWSNRILPAVYTDEISYYEVLCKTTEKLNEIVELANVLNDSVQTNSTEIIKIKNDIKIINDEIEKIKTGKYTQMYIDSLEMFIKENLVNIVGQIVKFVWFGLDDEGHFIAYIPTSWRFLNFYMEKDPDSDDYGVLYLSY